MSLATNVDVIVPGMARPAETDDEMAMAMSRTQNIKFYNSLECRTWTRQIFHSMHANKTVADQSSKQRNGKYATQLWAAYNMVRYGLSVEQDFWVPDAMCTLDLFELIWLVEQFERPKETRNLLLGEMVDVTRLAPVYSEAWLQNAREKAPKRARKAAQLFKDTKVSRRTDLDYYRWMTRMLMMNTSGKSSTRRAVVYQILSKCSPRVQSWLAESMICTDMQKILEVGPEGQKFYWGILDSEKVCKWLREMVQSGLYKRIRFHAWDLESVLIEVLRPNRYRVADRADPVAERLNSLSPPQG